MGLNFNQEHYDKLKNYSYYLLSRRDYSEKYLLAKFNIYIKKNNLSLANQDIQNLIEELKKSGFQSDEKLAFSIYDSLCNFHYGNNMINKKFLEKGISRDILSKIKEESDFDFYESCKIYFIKKFNNKTIDDKEKTKIIRHLLSRGFNYDEIKYAMNSK